jgi:hypothetical protein
LKVGAKRAYEKTRQDLDKIIGSGGIKKRVVYKKILK